MKEYLKILFLIIACVLSVSLVFTSCGEPTPNDDPSGENQDAGKEEKIEFTVTVKDYKGAAYNGTVLIEIYNGANMLGMMNSNANGVATFKLKAADYTFKIKSVDRDLYYDESECVLSKSSPTVTVTVYSKSTGKNEIFVPDSVNGMTEYEAANVGEGATVVTLDRAEMSYFIFTPTRSGIYKISIPSTLDGTVGNYGSSHFVQSPTEYNTFDYEFEIVVKDGEIGEGQGGTSHYVLGISSQSLGETILTIERFGDAPVIEEWIDIRADSSLLPYDNLLNHELIDIDITDPSLKVVFNSEDGLYHLGESDGPVILIRISSESKYLPSFLKICETDRLCKYFYDNDGNIVRKESYNALVEDYGRLCGSMGAYPLDATLAEAIKNAGDQNGWWNFESSGTASIVFADDYLKVVRDNAWLFACCYENKNAYGAEDKPILVSPSTPDEPVTLALNIKAGETLNLRATNAGTLVIEKADLLSVTIENETVFAENGRITVTFDEISGFTLKLSEESETDKTVYFTFN